MVNMLKVIKLGFCRFRSIEDYRKMQNYIAEATVTEIESRGIKLSELKVLELGCGCGGYSEVLHNKSNAFYASDLGKNEIFDQSKIPFIQIDVLKPFPVDANCFDFIYCSSLIEHLRNPDNLLSECWRILKPGGTLFLSFPPFYSLALIGGHQFKPFHFFGEKASVFLTKTIKRCHVKNYATAFGSFGLYPLKIDQVKTMLLKHRFNIKDIYNRMSPINTAHLPGILKDLTTWHVCYLAQKPG